MEEKLAQNEKSDSENSEDDDQELVEIGPKRIKMKTSGVWDHFDDIGDGSKVACL